MQQCSPHIHTHLFRMDTKKLLECIQHKYSNANKVFGTSKGFFTYLCKGYLRYCLVGWSYLPWPAVLFYFTIQPPHQESNTRRFMQAVCFWSLAWDWSVEHEQPRHTITFKYLLNVLGFKGMPTKNWTEVFVCEIAPKKSSVETHTILSAWVNSSSWETPSNSTLSALTKTRKKIYQNFLLGCIDYFIWKIFPQILQVKHLWVIETLYYPL